jgi:E3 ubiquitin-protein ligase RNF216
MFEEIEKARKKAEEKQASQKREDEQRMKDLMAKAVSTDKGELVECDICAEDRPLKYMASCNTKEKHTYCFVCVKTHIETIIGDGKHAAVCMTTNCKGYYSRQVLEQLLDKALVLRMERLQQNEELKGVKGIKDCPFCNFKAFCETPSKFDCQNPECLMSSCLKCKAETHPALSCAEYAKKKKEDIGESKGVRLRHLVEEAMTEALLRHCPYVLVPFVDLDYYMLIPRQTMQNAIHKRYGLQQDDLPNVWYDVLVM